MQDMKLEPQKTKASDGAVKRVWNGLGLFNVYFVMKFVLATLGYLNLDFLYNALLMAALLVPVNGRALRVTRQCVGWVAAIALVYAESWLPGIESILANKNAIAGFSATYVVQLVWDFINLQMVGWGLLAVLVYYLARPLVRVTVFTVGYFLFMVAMPWIDALTPEPAGDEVSVTAQSDAPQSAKGAVADTNTINEWYKAFIEYEKDRRANLPDGLAAKDTPFDILLLNICSLSNDDLIASGLESHPVFSRFNVRFDRFNSATAYSGPATLRLLNAACGQPEHNALYDGRRPECEILNRLGTLGYKQHLLMDHKGEYDNYLQTLRDKAGLTAPLESNRAFPVRYMAFDDDPISDDLAVMRHWRRSMQREKSRRNVTLMNFIALHDGNRLPRHSRWEPFKPRAKRLLDDLNTFLTELERSGRKVMVVVVPEHGAAVRGDKIQAPRLRDIPSMRITEVPVMVTFVGRKGLPEETIHVTGNTSYLALSELIGKTLSSNYFGKRGGSVPLDELVQDLPQTNPVSENGQAQVLEYKGRQYLRMNGGDWKPYVK